MKTWQKKGLIFKFEKIDNFLNSHAANPLPYHLKDDVYRVFFSSRNADNKSSVGYVDIDIIKEKVIQVCKEPLLTFGIEDSFYSHGISIGNIYQNKDAEQFILFMGWQIRENAHWRGDVGRIQLKSTDKMEINPAKAFMEIDEEDKVSLSYPFVMYHENQYKMWYGSTVDWTSENGEMIHVIKYATSKDGETWEKHGIAIPYKIGVAQAFSKPSVIVDENGYHMWYSYRSGTGETYRIGYSTSKDGIHWTNKLDEVGITVSNEGWDAEMICYPFVFDHHNKRYMLYNGNSYGKEGFGLAVLE